jgi:hypothetical protein
VRSRLEPSSAQLVPYAGCLRSTCCERTLVGIRQPGGCRTDASWGEAARFVSQLGPSRLRGVSLIPPFCRAESKGFTCEHARLLPVFGRVTKPR